MRLLERQGDNSFRLVSCDGKDQDIPPYAILSHTWGKDEVTFRDLIDGTASTKAGYRKLNFCAKQAKLDDLHFFWIDTCCIDKSSSEELLEAINSMFRWYRNSAKCYAYLEDVSMEESAQNRSAFQKSRWFTRGWTLQELLAPEIVDFFSAEGEPLGSKSSLVQELAKVTRVPARALQGEALSHFSVGQRLKWADGRETTREEDMAYSLLGIFDIQMPLFYSEGRAKAFKRLHREILNSQEADRRDGEEDVVIESSRFQFVLQDGTMLQETDEQFTILMADSEKEGPPDMIAVNRMGTRNDQSSEDGFRNIEINVLYGDSRYQNRLLRIATPKFTTLRDWTEYLDFTLTDWNGDGTLDLVVIKKSDTGTSCTEIHILSGASNFQDVLLQVPTILEETDDTWSFDMGRWGSGKKPDLFAINKSNTKTRSTEVHVLSGDHNFQKLLLRTDTGLHETDSQFAFVVADWNGDGRSDLVAIKKSKRNGKLTEVHVLSGASKYKEFIIRSKIPLYKSLGLFEFAVADWTGNGRPDLIAFKKRDTGMRTTEVHVMTQII